MGVAQDWPLSSCTVPFFAMLAIEPLAGSTLVATTCRLKLPLPLPPSLPLPLHHRSPPTWFCGSVTVRLSRFQPAGPGRGCGQSVCASVRPAGHRMKQHCRMALALTLTNSQGCIAWTDGPRACSARAGDEGVKQNVSWRTGPRACGVYDLLLTTVVTTRFLEPAQMFEMLRPVDHGRRKFTPQHYSSDLATRNPTSGS